MTHSGGHRVRSVARWVATPGLLLAAGLAGYATVVGATVLLRVSTVVALAVAVGAVVMFDTQLVRARRAHNADRAALARSYAATYAAHIRVTNPSSLEWAPVSDRKPEPWPAASSAPTVSVTSGGTPAPRSARPLTASTGADGSTVSTGTPTAPTSPAVPAAPVAQSPDMWAELEDAPTVVDMLAWEERARVGIVDAEQQPASSSAAKKAAAADEPTDDPRLHRHGPSSGHAESA